MSPTAMRAAKRARDTARKAAWRAKNREHSRVTDKLAKRRLRAIRRAHATPTHCVFSGSVQATRLKQSGRARNLILMALAL